MDTVEVLLEQAKRLNQRYDGRPANATEVLDIVIRLLTLSVEAKAKK